MSEICVVHLVWAPLGLSPFQKFITSYKEKTGGIDHNLLIIFNGFQHHRETSEYHALLDGLSYDTLVIPNSVQDISAYFAAARRFDYKYFCFLNSYSVLLDQHWLMKMHKYIISEGVGLVGATGSYESLYSRFVGATPALGHSLFSPRRIVHEYHRCREAIRLRLRFPPFPNYHIRTNAFMLSRNIMLKLKVGPLRSKQEAERFESGRRSLTRQIFAMNLKALVVGRDGKAYEKEQWYESCTFRSRDQHNLLVADNRTRQYIEADASTKQLLSAFAWSNR